jgi:ParB-like chromosome segregation protein Spo0J
MANPSPTSTANAASSNRSRLQSNRDNGRKQTAAETEADRQAAALAFADLLIANDATFCADNKSTHLLHADLDTAKIKEILDAGLTRNRLCKDLLKSRKKAARLTPRAPQKKKGKSK